MANGGERRSRALRLGVVIAVLCLVDGLVIFFTHPQEPHDSISAGVSMLLWPFILYPLCLFVAFILVSFDSKRGLRRQALIGTLVAVVSWPSMMMLGYGLSQKPWLSAEKRLHDRWPDVRLYTVQTLAGQDPNHAIPLLIHALHDSDPDVRAFAAIGLAGYGSKAESAIPDLITNLDDPNWFPACHAAEALGSMKGLQDRVLPSLTEHLGYRDSYLQWCIANAIVLLGRDAASAVPALTANLTAQDAAVRIRMCETLGAIGPKADAAIPGITAALQDPEEKVRPHVLRC